MTDLHTLRAQAAEEDRKAWQSFERCDTDGALSQWAHGATAQKLRLQAEIQEKGDRAEFPALFDLEGNLVPAKFVETRYGAAFGLLSDDNPNGRFIGWFNPSQALNGKRALANDRKKGYQVGYVLAPAKADLSSGDILAVRAVAKRTDGGFSPDAEIVDNPAENGAESWWYACE